MKVSDFYKLASDITSNIACFHSACSTQERNNTSNSNNSQNLENYEKMDKNKQKVDETENSVNSEKTDDIPAKKSDEYRYIINVVSTTCVRPNRTPERLLRVPSIVQIKWKKRVEQHIFLFLIHNPVAYRSSADVGRIHILGNLEIEWKIGYFGVFFG